MKNPLILSHERVSSSILFVAFAPHLFVDFKRRTFKFALGRLSLSVLTASVAFLFFRMVLWLQHNQNTLRQKSQVTVDP